MSSHTKDIIANLDAVSHETFGDNTVERLQVRAAARRLLARVETPNERAWGFGFEPPVVFTALLTGIDLGLWKSWTDAEGGEKTVEELVKLANTDISANLLRTPSSSP